MVVIGGEKNDFSDDGRDREGGDPIVCCECCECWECWELERGRSTLDGSEAIATERAGVEGGSIAGTSVVSTTEDSESGTRTGTVEGGGTGGLGVMMLSVLVGTVERVY